MTNPTTTKYFNTIRAFCQQNSDPAEIEKSARYFSEGYDGYGVKSKQLDSKAHDLLDESLPIIGVDGVLDLGDKLVSTGKYEEASFAIQFALRLSEHWTPDFFVRVGHWFEDNALRNWGHVDVCGGFVVGGMLKRKVVPLSALKPWIESPCRWKQRGAVISMVAPMRDKIYDAEEYFELLEPLMIDSEKVVQQGIGSTLKQALREHPDETEAFLMKWKDKASPQIIKLAIAKLPKEIKAEFKAVRS